MNIERSTTLQKERELAALVAQWDDLLSEAVADTAAEFIWDLNTDAQGRQVLLLNARDRFGGVGRLEFPVPFVRAHPPGEAYLTQRFKTLHGQLLTSGQYASEDIHRILQEAVASGRSESEAKEARLKAEATACAIADWRELSPCGWGWIDIDPQICRNLGDRGVPLTPPPWSPARRSREGLEIQVDPGNGRLNLNALSRYDALAVELAALEAAAKRLTAFGIPAIQEGRLD